MPIGKGRKIGNIGGPARSGGIGTADGFTGDSLGTGVEADRFSRSQYPTTTSTTTTTTTTSSSTTTTTTTAP